MIDKSLGKRFTLLLTDRPHPPGTECTKASVHRIRSIRSSVSRIIAMAMAISELTGYFYGIKNIL
jgi:hypothetical protein